MVENKPAGRRLNNDRRYWQKRLKPVSAVVLILSLFAEANYDLVNRMSARLLFQLGERPSPTRDCKPGPLRDENAVPPGVANQGAVVYLTPRYPNPRRSNHA